MDTIALLRHAGIFTSLDEAALQHLAERCVPRAYRPGYLLFREGEACAGMYIIRSGRVRVFRATPDGRDQVIGVMVTGQAINELSLFDEGPCPASAVTLEETRLLFLAKADFDELYGHSPEMVQPVIRALVGRLRHDAVTTDPFGGRDVAARLALLLADYADRTGETTDDGVALTLRRTQEELSREIGTARESVSRAFKTLRQRGLLQQVGHDRILIRNVAQLRAAAHRS